MNKIENNDTNRATIAAMFAREMKRWGVSKARLTRRAREFQTPEIRVREALAGNPGRLGRWNEVAIDDWIRMIRTAWNY